MKLAIVVPCYNEQEVLPDTVKKLTVLMNELTIAVKVSKDSFIMFVDDGSRDDTWQLISKYASEYDNVQGLKLAGNVGHQNALLAGLMTVRTEVDAAISIDADLQDDIAVISEMTDKYNEGFDIVYGVRSARKTDTFFKRFTAEGFYKLMKAMGAKSVYNHADFRLMSSRALEGLAQSICSFAVSFPLSDIRVTASTMSERRGRRVNPSILLRRCLPLLLTV